MAKKIQTVTTEALKPVQIINNEGQLEGLPKNPRFIRTKDFEDLKTSIQECPEMTYIREVVVFPFNEHYIVIAGNMRFRAMEDLGFKTIPCKILHKSTPIETLREIAIKDNVHSGKDDWDIIANEWNKEEVEAWGVDLPLFEEEVIEAVEDDYVEPEKMKVDVVLGDLIEIGEHRLLCGDSTDSDQVAKLMEEKIAHMCFTDPPYLMGFQGGMQTNENGNWTKSFNAKHGEIKNDKMSDEEGADFLDGINTNISLFVSGAFYICFYRLGLGGYFASLERTGLKVRTLITWNKGNHTLSNSDYMSKCEHIFYGWVTEHNFYGGNNGMDIWDIPRTQKNDLHPTMKPIPLCEKALNDGSKKGDIVLDLFLGSGSTMVAAEQLERKCYGMELDPKYCQVIIDRMVKLDETLIVKINGKEYKKQLTTN